MVVLFVTQLVCGSCSQDLVRHVGADAKSTPSFFGILW